MSRMILSAPAGRRDFLRGVSLAGAGAVLASAVPPAAAAAGEAITVLRRATLIDGTGAPPRPATTIVIIGERITWTGPGHEAPRPGNALVIDLNGKVVIPGLWDMHAHGSLQEKIAPPLYVVNGVTGIREMMGLPGHHALRARIDRGEVLGPRMVIGSAIVDGPVSVLGPLPVKVGTEAEARQAVREAKAGGAEFLKVYSYLPRDLLRVLADEAAKLGLPMDGHLPYLVPMEEASRLGQRSIEHLTGLTLATSSREAEFRSRLESTPITDPFSWYAMARDLERQAAAGYDPAKARRLYAELIRNGTWHTPTLAVLKVFSQPADACTGDPRLKYIPAADRRQWLATLKAAAPDTPEEIARDRRFFRQLLTLTGRLHRAGAGLLGGTDSYSPFVIPGFSAHDELSLLVRAGLPPMAALQAMTRDAARFLGRAATTGTVTPGKLADLVVLDADPLADIRNVRRIHAVMTRGRYLGPRDRERILAEVEKAARNPAAPDSAAPDSAAPDSAAQAAAAACACR
ncbi:amidohydrolase family protein [Nonomuraea typhae]|uniref:amidohydrolase family protein n=1 Tax=Nonomuraea typhae TaxID=2603600 RepID=UPI001CA59058|nr:amidohydrolase family protein [Nonomuraea typhae]